MWTLNTFNMVRRAARTPPPIITLHAHHPPFPLYARFSTTLLVTPPLTLTTPQDGSLLFAEIQKQLPLSTIIKSVFL
jgi:hypothetical protein